MSGKPNDKMFQTMVNKFGSEEKAREWFAEIGARGGRNGNTGGFAAATPEQRSEWGRKGGKISRKRKKENTKAYN